MASPKDKLSKLLQMSGLNAKYQEGRILLYNRDRDNLAMGISLNGFPDATKVAQEYLNFIRGSGFIPLSEFVELHSDRFRGSVNFREVPNKVDPQSPYYVAAMPSLSRINLLKAARELETRVAIAQEMRKLGPVSDSEVRRHKKMKRMASIYRGDSETIL